MELEEMTICTNCKFCYRKTIHDVWQRYQCSTPKVQLSQKEINPVNGTITWENGRWQGYPFCQEINTKGCCPYYKAK